MKSLKSRREIKQQVLNFEKRTCRYIESKNSMYQFDVKRKMITMAGITNRDEANGIVYGWRINLEK